VPCPDDRPPRPRRRLFRVLPALASSLVLVPALPAGPPKPPPPTTLTELRAQIQDILKKSLTPGAGVALVRRRGPEWVAGIGWADLAAKVPATEETLFRIGSVSKGFVSLSVLKLQEEGRLSLQDTLRSRAPDLAFANPWEATDPVRIVHLLEHTAGWDDLSLGEFALNRMPEMTLKEGLDYHPRTRTSRWKPGTRYSYSNGGPPAAAYVVERITGQRFEDYVEQTWFKPLHMDTASYLDTPQVERRLTKLYHRDGVTPYPYWHIGLRPAGSINASARDMAHYLQFYLDRGAYGGVQLLPASAIDRMETPTSTYAAREGLKVGYGLSSMTAEKGHWMLHGHEGGVPGGQTQFAYLPEADVGYVVMVNSANGGALHQIGELLRTYATRSLTPPGLPKEGPPSALAPAYAGWYEPISPRNEQARFLARLLGLMRLHAGRKALTLQRLFSGRTSYVTVSDRWFREPSARAPTLALIADASEGTLIQAAGDTYRRVPSWLPWTEFSVAAAAFLLMASSLVFALVWVPRKLLGELRAVPLLRVRALPALAALSLLIAFLLVVFAGDATLDRLGRPSPWSIGLFLATTAFAVFAVLGLVLALLYRKRSLGRLVWWHALAASVLMTLVAAYLAYWGVIGVRTWA
jgi:CubicO group peptidase (beta-lactamase class C family)